MTGGPWTTGPIVWARATGAEVGLQEAEGALAAVTRAGPSRRRGTSLFFDLVLSRLPRGVLRSSHDVTGASPSTRIRESTKRRHFAAVLDVDGDSLRRALGQIRQDCVRLGDAHAEGPGRVQRMDRPAVRHQREEGLLASRPRISTPERFSDAPRRTSRPPTTADTSTMGSARASATARRWNAAKRTPMPRAMEKPMRRIKPPEDARHGPADARGPSGEVHRRPERGTRSAPQAVQ